MGRAESEIGNFVRLAKLHVATAGKQGAGCKQQGKKLLKFAF